MNLKENIGELIGTFILVFIGCGSVGLAVLFGTFSSIIPIALIWGAGVTLAIYTTRIICPAHFNPAVSFAFLLEKNISFSTFIQYTFFQIIGAFLAAALLYFFLGNEILVFEQENMILRGYDLSRQTAMMFGEFYPNPGNSNLENLSTWKAMLFEGVGTFVLVLVILLLASTKRRLVRLGPIIVGLTVAAIIIVVAPYTQAGLNPARDFGPRIFAYFAGWGEAAFPVPFHGFFTVYMLAPLIGALAAQRLSRLVNNAVQN